MSSKNILSYFVLLVLIKLIFSRTCLSNREFGTLQTGNIIVSANDLTQNTTEHIFPIPISPVLKAKPYLQSIAFPKNITVQTSKTSEINFIVQTQTDSKTNSINVIFTLKQKPAWTKFYIAFIISSRSDVSMDSFHMQPPLSTLTQTIKYNFTSQLAHWNNFHFKDNVTLNIICLYSGMQGTISNKTQITVNTFSIDQKNGLFNLSLTFQNGIISDIYVSYFIYDPVILEIQHYPFTQFETFISNDYFVGIVFNSDSTFDSTLLFFSLDKQNITIPCVGKACTLPCLQNGQLSCIARQGFISNGTCFLCSNDQLFLNGNCQSICGLNMIYKDSKCQCQTGFYPTTTKDCYKCPPFSTWNSTYCACNDGYFIFMYSSQCKPCPQNSYFDSASKKCICNQNRHWFQDFCVCPRDQTTCFNCPRNSKVVNGSCQCNPGFKNVSNDNNSSCIPSPIRPPLPIPYNPLNPKCDDSLNMMLGWEMCICKPGFYKYNNNQIGCTKCPTDTKQKIYGCN